MLRLGGADMPAPRGEAALREPGAGLEPEVSDANHLHTRFSCVCNALHKLANAFPDTSQQLGSLRGPSLLLSGNIGEQALWVQDSVHGCSHPNRLRQGPSFPSHKIQDLVRVNGWQHQLQNGE